jgi:hypothetical protein
LKPLRIKAKTQRGEGPVIILYTTGNPTTPPSGVPATLVGMGSEIMLGAVPELGIAAVIGLGLGLGCRLRRR